jgi:hypothetical protein
VLTATLGHGPCYKKKTFRPDLVPELFNAWR